MNKITKEKIKAFFYKNYIALTLGVLLVILGPFLVFSTTYEDDTESKFNDGAYNGTTYNTSSSTLEISTSTNIWSLPNNQTNGWVDMSNNQLLLHLNEEASNSSTIFSDSSGLGNDGSCPSDSECPSVVSDGKMHGAMEFDGSDDFVTTSKSNSLDVLGDFTIGMWVRPDTVSPSWQTLYEFEGSDDRGLWLNNDNFVYWDPDIFNDSIEATNILSANEWQHLVVTRRGNSWNLYYNGINVKSANQSRTMSNLTSDVSIGKDISDNKYNYDGAIDELFVFNRSLSTSSIKKIFNRQKSEKSGVYKSQIFDEGSKTNWKTLSWTPNFPYLKELPDRQAKETAYETGNVDMGSNVALWHMNDNGSTSTDSSGNSNNGTLKNRVTTGAPGKFGNAMSFDGSDDYIEINKNLIDGYDNFSVSAWIKANKIDSNLPAHTEGDYGNTILDKSGDDDDNFNFSIGGNDEVYFYIDNANGNTDNSDAQGSSFNGDQNLYTTNSPISANTWHHIVVTYDDNKQRIYVDGYQEASRETSGSVISNNLNLTVGAKRITKGREAEFDGRIDETAIFDKPLSTSTIKDIYQRGVQRLKFQVRSCDDSSCSGEEFTGPNGKNIYYSELDNNSSSTPSISLSEPVNRYFQYKAFLESESSTQNVQLSSVEITSGNTAPTATIDKSPRQINGSEIKATTTVSDSNNNVTSLSVEYSLDNSTWNNAILSTSSQFYGEGNGVNISGNKIKNIDTDLDGTIDLRFRWDIDQDLPNTEDSSVYLRVTPKDSIGGSGALKKSNSFEIDNKTDSTDLVDDDLGDFHDGYNSSTIFDTDIDKFRLKKKKEFPENQKNGWVDMTNNELLWHLDYSDARDSSGNNRNGSLNGGIKTEKAGKIGRSMKFDGTDDYIDAGYRIDQSSGNSYTFSLWVKPFSTSSGPHYPISTDNGGFDWAIPRGGDDWEIFDGSSSYDTTFDVDVNEWQHIVGVWDHNSNKTRFYKNGKEFVINSLSHDTSDNNLNIGRTPYNGGVDYFDGFIDEVAVINEALSKTEVKKIYEYQKNSGSVSSGTLKSRVFDLNYPTTTWNNISWNPKAPYLKELPDNQAKETAYETGNVDMSNNTALWHMNDTGSTSTDSSGNDNDGTLKNGVTTGVNGKFGNAMSFDGNDDYLIDSDPDNLPSGDVSKSISAWFKTNDSSSRNNIGGFGNNSTGSNFQVGTSNDSGDGKWKVWGWGSSYDWNTGIENDNYTQNSWNHVVVTYDGSSTKIYFNGTKQAETSNYNWDTDPQKIVIGNEIDESGHEFNGRIDEFAIFNTALSTSTIKDIYQRGVKRLKFQVRSCDDKDCAGEKFIGSDGTTSTHYTASTQSTSPSTTPTVSLASTPDNKYFQYKTVFESDTNNSPKLASVSIDGEIKNDPPTTTIDTTPAQIDKDSVSTTITITEPESQTSSLEVEYSLDGTSWSSSTIGFVSQNGEGDGVNTSTGKISDIDTDKDGTVKLTLHWDIAQDLGQVETSSAYLRFDPSDPYDTGITNKTSQFSVDTSEPTQPGKLSVNSLTSSSIKFDYPSNTSSDSNFDQYKIYISSSSPANSSNFDQKYTSSTDANMNDSNFNGADSTDKISGLNPNEKYYFKLFAYDTFSNSTSSVEANTNTNAVVPSNLTTSTITTSSIKLSWDKNGNPDGTDYQVKNITIDNKSTTSSTKLTLNNLDPDKKYEFKVRAKNSAGVYTNYTSKISEYTHAKVPSAPTLSNFTSSSIDISIQKNGNPADTTYAIYNETEDYYLASDGTDNGATPVYQTTSTWGGQTAKNLSVNKQYEFTTKAKNQSGVTTSKSPTSSAKYTLAAVPTNLITSSVSNSSIDLSWNQNSNPAGTEYELENVTEVNTVTTTNTSTTESGLNPNKKYEFKVRAINGNDKTTDYTGKISEYTHANQPNQPTASSITTSTVDLEIAENNNPSQTEFALYSETNNFYIDSNGNTSSQPYWQQDGSGADQTVKNLDINKQYKFSTIARNADNIETATSKTTITTDAAVPTNLTTSSVSNSNIKLSWNKNGNPDGTSYQINNVGGGSFTTTSSPKNFTGLDPDTNYEFKVRAKNSTGVYSSYTPKLDEYTKANVPNKPALSNVASTSLQLDISPNSNPAHTEYAIYNTSTNYYINSNGNTTTSATWQKDSAWGSQTIKNLAIDTKYSFITKARNQDKIQTASSTKVVTTTLAAKPANFTTSTITTSSMKFSWGSNGNPSDIVYQLRNISDNSNATTTNTSLNRKNLEVNQEYKFKLRAKNSADRYTNFTKTITNHTLAKVPTDPKPTNPTTNSLDVEIKENSNPANTTYAIYNETNGNYIDSTGSATDTPIYQTTSTWSNQTAKNLSINKKYKFSTKAKNGDEKITSNSPKSSGLYTLAAKPINFSSTTITTSSVSFSWNKNGNPDGTIYELNNTTDNKTTTTTNTSTKSDQLDINSKYNYKLRAKNGDNIFTDYTSTNTIYTYAAIPAQVVSSTVTTSSIELNWSSNGNPSSTKYKIKNLTSSTTHTTSTTSSVFDKLDLNKKYNFKLQAINKDGISTNLTNTTSIFTHTTVPTKPTKKSASQNSLTLSWTGNGSTYNLKTADNAVDISGLTKSKKKVTGLTCGTNYQFHARAFNSSSVATNFSKKNSFSTKSCPEPTSSGGGGGGSFSATDEPDRQNYKPNVRIVNVGKHEATVEFETDEITSAKLIYGKDGKYNLQTNQESSFTKQHKFKLDDLGSNAQFDFKIQLKNSNQTEFTFGPYEFTTRPKLTTPPNVVDFSAEVKQQSVKLSWANPNIEKFASVQINRSTSTYPSSPKEGKVIFTGSAKQFSDQTVQPGQTYFYTIFVKNTQDKYSSGVLQPVVVPEQQQDKDTKREEPQEPAFDATKPRESDPNEETKEKTGRQQEETTTTQETGVPTTTQDKQKEQTTSSTKKQQQNTTTTEKEENQKKQQDDDVLDQAKQQLENIKETLGLGEETEKQKEKKKQQDKEPTKQEKLEPTPDKQAFDKTKPTKEPPTPSGVKQLEESAVNTNKIDLFSLVKQTAQSSAQAIGSKARQVSNSAKEQVSQGYKAAKKGATQVYKLSKSTQKELSNISKDLINQAGNLSLKTYQQLSKQEQKQVNQKLDKPLPPEFDSSTVADIKPLNVKSDKAEQAGADWHVFSSSNALFSIPESALDKPVSDIIVSFTDQAYVLKHNKDTNTYEAIVKAPKQKGKYEMNIQIIYQDNTYEQLKRSVLVDPYGYVYTEKFRDFSWSKPWQIFTTKRKKIKDVVVTLYTKNKTNEWVKWPADLYNQENPQTTKENGRFAFVTPEGQYYLQVKHENYPATETDVFEVKDKVVNINVELDKFSLLEKISVGILVLLILAGGAVGYLKYKDKFDF